MTKKTPIISTITELTILAIQRPHRYIIENGYCEEGDWQATISYAPTGDPYNRKDSIGYGSSAERAVYEAACKAVKALGGSPKETGSPSEIEMWRYGIGNCIDIIDKLVNENLKNL